MWIAGLALIIKEMKQSFLKKLIPITAICLTLTTTFGNDEILNNYRRIFGVYHLPPFKEYMASDQFEEIKSFIKEDPKNYRVACIGMNPSILQYNGFYTLDGLQSVYDLNYKNKFREIFANELEKDEEIKQYFDGWGNRCYIFSYMLGKDWISSGAKEIEITPIIDINVDAFKNLGGKYLMSPFLFNFKDSENIQLIKVFSQPDSYWNIHLYQVK